MSGLKDIHRWRIDGGYRSIDQCDGTRSDDEATDILTIFV